QAGRDDAELFLRLATLRLDVPLEEDVGDLEWRGVRPGFAELCAALGDEGLARRVAEAGGPR
ncbi:MAG: hypothetical protein ACM3MJ_09865, partial [Deltaproteobacteria bacterium]